jgi:hypothetical protein
MGDQDATEKAVAEAPNSNIQAPERFQASCSEAESRAALVSPSKQISGASRVMGAVAKVFMILKINGLPLKIT